MNIWNDNKKMKMILGVIFLLFGVFVFLTGIQSINNKHYSISVFLFVFFIIVELIGLLFFVTAPNSIHYDDERDYMKQQILFTYNNAFECADKHLQQIYGERGSFEHNIKRYVQSDVFLSLCRQPKSIQEIPEAMFSDLLCICKREESFRANCENIIEKYDHLIRENRMTNEELLEFGGIMGVCPGRCNWTETLFPHLVDLFVSSDEEADEIFNNVQDHLNVLSVLIMQLSDCLRVGQIYDLEGRRFWSQGYARNLFRGENAYYKRSIPSLFRYDPDNTDDNLLKIYRLVETLKISEFARWIRSFDFIRNWRYSDIFDSVIAQHYGLKTSYLDMTSSIKTALFFACCHWDSEKERWRPLYTSEYQYEDSRQDVYKVGGDSRYGIIHIAPADISAMSMCLKSQTLNITCAYPIGYQPFLRCSNQYGFIVKGYPGYDMFYDPAFNELKLRLTKEITEWIYDEMDEGRRIYPEDLFGDMSSIIEDIHQTKEISIASFELLMESWKRENESLDANYYRQLLFEGGYKLVDKPQWQEDAPKTVYEDKWNRMNNHYPNTTVSVRPSFCI